MDFIKNHGKVSLIIGIILYTILVSFISIESYKAYVQWKAKEILNENLNKVMSDYKDIMEERGSIVNTNKPSDDGNQESANPTKESTLDNTNITKAATTSQKMYDYANLLSSSEEKSITEQINSYIKEYNIDMGIVTIDENDKGSSQKYADDFVDENGFGIGSDMDCILFLIDMDCREIYISTTGRAIRIYNDEKIDKILEICFNEISTNRYYECCKAFIDGTIKEYTN